MDWEDTIVGPGTTHGSGCLAIVRLTGRDCSTILARQFAREHSSNTFHRSFIQSRVLRIDAWRREVKCTVYGWPSGHSYTGQPSAEIHLPSCAPLVSAVETQLLACGARLARPGEFTLRAFLSGRLDLTQAEGVLGLIEAENLHDLHAAIDQRAGGLSKPIADVRADLLDLLADLEAGLDFVEEDISFVSQDQLVQRLSDAREEIERLMDSLSRRALEHEIPRILLVGLPNAGKSSLFNALVGGRHAIVSPIAGTTRDTLHATITLGGRPVEIVDTAGVEEADDEISRQSADQRTQVAKSAAIILECIPIDDSRPFSASSNLPPRLRVRTKLDLAPATPMSDADVHVSSRTGGGMDDLLTAMARLLDSGETRTPSTNRAHATARVRASLTCAREDLCHALEMAENHAGQEYVAVAIREALEHLGEIVGVVYTDDLLDRIFARFCIGK
ncbi:MAG: GTPase [Planctomycetota bacterium]